MEQKILFGKTIVRPVRKTAQKHIKPISELLGIASGMLEDFGETARDVRIIKEDERWIEAFAHGSGGTNVYFVLQRGKYADGTWESWTCDVCDIM